MSIICNYVTDVKMAAIVQEYFCKICTGVYGKKMFNDLYLSQERPANMVIVIQ